MDDKKQEQGKPDFQEWYDRGGRFKEQLEAIATEYRQAHGGGVEKEPIFKEKPAEAVVEIPTLPELEKKPELEGYIEKVEKESELGKPVIDDYTQQVLMSSPGSLKNKIQLPLTEEEIKNGPHHKIWEGIRWLAEWCARQAKMLHGKILYRDGGTPSSQATD
jgi:hypothetical protein